MPRMTDVNALKKQMIDCGIESVSHLSRITGINRNTLGAIMNGKTQPSAESMERIVKALGIEPVDAGRIFFSSNLRIG